MVCFFTCAHGVWCVADVSSVFSLLGNAEKTVFFKTSLPVFILHSSILDKLKALGRLYIRSLNPSQNQTIVSNTFEQRVNTD